MKLDKTAIRNEIIACAKNPAYFIKKYVKIQHPTRGLISFDLFDYQEDLLESYRKNRFNVILKARQLGISEITAAYALWLLLFRRDKNILVMATKAEVAKNIIRKIQVAWKKLPSWLVLTKNTVDNRMSLEFDNGSRIKAIASSDDAGRSEALSLLIIDEAAHVPNLEDLWTGLLPTVTAGGKVIMLSTPNGVGNLFHRIYTEAELGLNDFKPTRLMWWRHPERISDLQDDPHRPGFKTSTWYRNEVKATNMSPRDVAQELECNFNASGDTVVSAQVIEWIEKECVYDPLSRELFDRNLFVWHQPRPSDRYFISADVARGDGKDFSAFHVWEVDTMMQCAEYCGKVKPDAFADMVCAVGRQYNDAAIVMENNNIGMACLSHVIQKEYPAVYFSRRKDDKAGEIVNTAYTYGDDLVPGFTTSPKTRPLIVTKLEEQLRNRHAMVNSVRLLAELKTFIWVNGRPEAMRGFNDDLTMSAAIGLWFRETVMSTNFASAQVQEKLILGITSTRVMNTQIPGASKDPRFARSVLRQPSQNELMRVTLPDGTVEDFSWVLGTSPITKG